MLIRKKLDDDKYTIAAWLIITPILLALTFLFILVLGWALSNLWNYAVAPLGLKEISTFQGVAIYLIFQILFPYKK